MVQTSAAQTAANSQIIVSDEDMVNSWRSPKFRIAPPSPDIRPILNELIIPNEVEVAPSEPCSVFDMAALTQVLKAIPVPKELVIIARYRITIRLALAPSVLELSGK